MTIIKYTYIVIFLVGGCLERCDPFFHFSTGFGAQDERPERSDDLVLFFFYFRSGVGG